MSSRKYITAKYSVPVHGCALPAGSFRIAFLSDLHNACSEAETREILSRIAREKPDLILCGGDMIVARNRQPVNAAARFMKRLSSRMPVYLGTGNHEYRARIYPEVYGDMYEQYRALLADTKVVFLEDSYADVDVPLHGRPEEKNEGTAASGNTSGTIPVRILGFDLPAEYYSRFRRHTLDVETMREHIGSPDPERVNILLAHNPRYMDTYMDWGADLVLCGHYHGGMVRLWGHRGLVSPDLVPFSGKCYGHFEKGESHAIVTSGCGEHTVPIRIHNPREIVSAEIRIC